jgi:foldase protein PrsA
MSLALAVSVGLSSCDNLPAKAATVNGSDITRADFERDIKTLAANPSLFNITGATERTIGGDTARQWLSQLIIWRAAESLLAAHGLSPSADATKQVEDQLKTPAAAKLPQSMKDEVVRGAAAVQSLTQVPAPSREQLAAQYASEPASTGTLCARHILVKTRAEAESVLGELAGGADFADVAKRRSTEAGAKDTGGALTGSDGNACLPLSTYRSEFDADFTAGALAARAGVPTDPVKSQFGWHVILVRPFDEVATDLTKLVATSPGEIALGGALGTADVTIDPRYGRWDPVKADVASLH